VRRDGPTRFPRSGNPHPFLRTARISRLPGSDGRRKDAERVADYAKNIFDLAVLIPKPPSGSQSRQAHPS
jgi:hypothetical protein